MPVKLLMAIALTTMCVISLQCVDARALRKPSPPDDVTGNDVTSRDTVVKRPAREMRARRRTYSAPVALGVPVMARQAGPLSTLPVADAWGPMNDVEHSQVASLLADVALLEHLRRHPPAEHHRRQPWAAAYGQFDDYPMSSVKGVYSSAYGGPVETGIPTKRTIVHLRSPRELHPVYLGLGQNAASAALNTYASLLADEKRRESLEEQQQQGSANPVRFIGRR